MPKLEPLNLRINGDSRGLSQALGRSERDTRNFADGVNKQSGKLTAGISSISAKAGAAGVAVTAAFASIAAAAGTAYVAISKIRDIQSEIDETAKSADRLNVSFNELKSFEFAVKSISGAELDVARDAIKEIQIRLSEAKDGAGAAKEALDRLGLDAGRLIELGPLRALQAISEEFRNIENGSEQIRIANDLLGEAGAQLVSTLRAGKSEIASIVAFHEKWNGLSEDQVQDVESANAAWGEIAVIIDGVSIKLAASVAPAMRLVAEAVLDIANSLEDVDGYLNRIARAGAVTLGILGDIAEVRFAIERSLASALAGDFSAIPDKIREALDFSSAQQLLDGLDAAKFSNQLDEKLRLALLNKTTEAMQEQNAVAQETTADLENVVEKLREIRDPGPTAAILKGSAQDVGGRALRERQNEAAKSRDEQLKGIEKRLADKIDQPRPDPGEVEHRRKSLALLDDIKQILQRTEPALDL